MSWATKNQWFRNQHPTLNKATNFYRNRRYFHYDLQHFKPFWIFAEKNSKFLPLEAIVEALVLGFSSSWIARNDRLAALTTFSIFPFHLTDILQFSLLLSSKFDLNTRMRWKRSNQNAWSPHILDSPSIHRNRTY